MNEFERNLSEYLAAEADRVEVRADVDPGRGAQSPRRRWLATGAAALTAAAACLGLVLVTTSDASGPAAGTPNPLATGTSEPELVATSAPAETTTSLSSEPTSSTESEPTTTVPASAVTEPASTSTEPAGQPVPTSSTTPVPESTDSAGSEAVSSSTSTVEAASAVFFLQGYTATCSALDADAYDCTVPTYRADGGPSVGMVQELIDDSWIIVGGCRATTGDGLHWRCYTGQRGIDEGVVADSRLGVWQEPGFAYG